MYEECLEIEPKTLFTGNFDLISYEIGFMTERL